MKITRVETFKFWVDWCNWLLVRISTDEGIVGWGEASLHGADYGHADSCTSLPVPVRMGRLATKKDLKDG